MTDFKPTLTVITIVYNNVKDIERTLQSVIHQDYPHIEYVVIDGASTDGTLDILHQYQSHITTLISEPDKGIYDAMNKGLAAAKGDFVLFMNSGDEIFAPHTVSAIFSSKPDQDVYYGETEMYSEQWKSLGRRRHQAPERLNFHSFKYGMSVCHQAIYLRKSLCEPYNLQYKYSADIDWILRILKKTTKTHFVPQYVAKYLVGGMSKKKHRESLIERYHIFKKHYGFLPNLFHHLVIAIRLLGYFVLHGRTND